MKPAKDPNGTPGTPEGATTAWPWSLACLSLSMLMPSLDTSIANLALPTLARALGASFHQAQWVVLAYLLALTSLIVGAGRLGDLFGRRRLLLAGILLFTGASLFCGTAHGLGQLLAARAVQGLGAAAMIASTLALAGEAVPRARTGLAMGLLGTMSAIGTMLGPSIGGVLITGFGWRSIFLVNVPLGLLNLWLAGRQLPADRPRPAGTSRFDLPGALLLALTLAAYALAMTLERGAAGPVRLALLAAAGLGAAGFARLEAATAAPLVPVARLRDPALRSGLVMNVLVATVMMTTLVVGPFYLSLALGLAPAQVGLVMAAGFRTTFGVAAALVLAAAALALQARREPVPGRPDADAGAEAGS
jgi:MFS family permease